MSDSAQSKKVLVCDDDENLVHIIERLLVKRGFAVVKANDGGECLEKLKEEKPDLLLLDIDMPKLNGFQILEALAGDPGLAPPGVIVVSAHQKADDELRAYKLGAKKFIVKPFNCVHLVDEVQKTLGGDQKKA